MKVPSELTEHSWRPALRVAMWSEPRKSGTMLDNGKGGEGIRRIPKVAMREVASHVVLMK